MARLFDGVDDQIFSDSPPVTAAPFTVSLWFYPLDDTITRTMWAIGDKDTFNQYYQAQTAGTLGGDPIRYTARNAGTLQNLDTSTGWTANAWNHFCAIERAANDRSVYCNGGGKTDGTTSVTPSGSDRMMLASTANSGDFWGGRLAENAIWDAGLNDDEVVALAKGFSPLLIRPQSLVYYARLHGNIDPEPDRVGGLSLTVTGATKEDHCRVFMPGRARAGAA